MAGILDSANRHLLTEKTSNEGNSFIANINNLVKDLENIDKVASDLANIDIVATNTDSIKTVRNNIEDIVRVAVLKSAIETLAGVSDYIPIIVSDLDQILAVYAKLPEIDFVANSYQSIVSNLSRLEQLADRLAHDQNELIALTNDNKTFVAESEARINSLISQINTRVAEATQLVQSIQGIRDDIDVALRNALLPTITDEVVDNASEKAAEILEAQFTGDTDFVRTYNNTYAGIEDDTNEG